MSSASHEFKGSVDFNQNELRNATFQRLTTPPISPVQGQIYYNTPLQSPFYWDETRWNPFGLPPVHIRYTNEAALLADQTKQIEGYIYYNTELDIYYEYLGTTVGTMADYNPIGGSGMSNNEVKVIYVNPDDLSGTGTIEEQICEYINANITIDYTRHYSKINIVLGVDPSIIPDPEPIEIYYGSLYNLYTVVDARNIANEGWKVPSLDDLRLMSDYLGGFGDYTTSNNIGIKVKDDVFGWSSGSSDNASMFNARGSGFRTTSGSFGGFGFRNHIWSNTSPDPINFEAVGNNFGLLLGASNFFQTSTSVTYQPKAGNSIRLLKESTTLSDGESGIYIGNDGAVYRTICIGTQEWTADNLIESKYRNGDDIPIITDNAAWAALSTGARCYYNNDQNNSHP